ncbi:hypothetical protein OG206_24090 [Streptomyces sp. NBC_01341]|uniref:hypothetical protein n=1 Tax=Streptomyces sp. NBC_01341 TaxID=2903831 RepID=UPI002E0E72D4|nr:hypothetical protein OG206_24090 [Streptomyces sp. NBC_01341]
MGWTVLYIAFGIVALWLLGEVLLQYKARLRWRLLAFCGFLGVVLGVLIPSVLVIALGAIAFATGQTYVTLSFRRGFSTGWALGGSPGESRRRRGAGVSAPQQPVLEVSDLEYEGASPSLSTEQEPPAAVYETQPMPDDTGQYGIYTDPAPAGGEQQPQYAAYDPYSGYGQQTPPDSYGDGSGGYPSQDTYQDQGAYPGQDTYRPQETFHAQGAYTGQYDYGPDPTGYPAYSDPYAAAGATDGTGQYAAYDNGYDNSAFGDQGHGYDPSQGAGPHQPADPYAGQYTDTPPGGVWVPQQRESDQYPPLPPEEPVQPGPYGNGYDTGQNEQYRY